MNEPELRFSGFTDEWSKYRLADITSKIGSGKTPRGGSDVYTKNGVYLIRSQNVLNEGLDLNDAAYIDDKTDEDMKNSRVKFGDVLLNITGASIGRCAVFKEHVRANVSQHVCIIRPKNSSFVSDFIQMKLISENGQNQIKVNQAGGGRQGLNFAQIGDISFYFPDVAEQQKIADLFSTIDNVIDSVQKEVDSWEQMKRGVMQKLFSQEVRFKADDGTEFPEWEKIEFGQLIQEYNEKTNKENEDILLSAAIEGMFLNSELFGHQRGASNKGYKKVKYGTMVLSTQNLHLGNANVNTRFEHGIVSPAYKTYNIVGCSVDFMAQWVKTEYAKKFFYDATTVGASVCRRNVEWNTLYRQKLLIPCLEEQQKIADCLSEFDSVIEKTKQKLEAYKQLKKGLMQRMFV